MLERERQKRIFSKQKKKKNFIKKCGKRQMLIEENNGNKYENVSKYLSKKKNTTFDSKKIGFYFSIL